MEDAEEQQHRNERAAQWYARLHAPDCSADDRDAFIGWLNADPQNERRYRALERFLRGMDALGERDPRYTEIADRALDIDSPSMNAPRTKPASRSKAPTAD